MMRWPLVGVSLLLAAAGPAWGEGKNLPVCTSLSWTPPTTYTDGTPLPAGALASHNVYIQPSATPAPVPDTTVPTATVAAPAASWACGALGKGQHHAWVTAVLTTGAESPLSDRLPFVLGVPAADTGLQVQ